MMQLRARVDGEDRVFSLAGEEVRIGRGPDNDVQLTDPSVSRHHALLERGPRGWVVRDLESTNGTRRNGRRVRRSPVMPGDRLKIGAFELDLEEVTEGGTRQAGEPTLAEPPGTPRPAAGVRTRPTPPSRVPNASIVRPLAEFSAAYGMEAGFETPDHRERAGRPDTPSGATVAEGPGTAPGPAWGDRIFGLLTRLAKLLITADTVPEVLERVMEIAFEALPVERGFILLEEGEGDPVCVLSRHGDEVVHRPREGVPISRTILDAVMEDRLALLTIDAQVDDRLATGESIRIHGIRAAMSAPLWSDERIIGIIQVDSPVQAGAFTERDLDLLTALSNYAAVAVERLRNARRVAVERRLRSRFERYHSPAVIQEVVEQMMGTPAVDSGDISPEAEEGLRSLRATEASVLFADLVGFSAFAERLDPGEVAELLESYFDLAVEAIFAAGGTLDKFIGDAVMAFFGPPRDDPDHARRAVEAALDLRRRVEEWRRERRRGALPALRVRIGVNSGPVVVGDVGTARRADYTVLGNTVNVAARLEQLVAAAGEIVVGEETRRRLAGEVETEDLGERALRGLEGRVRVHRLVGDRLAPAG